MNEIVSLEQRVVKIKFYLNQTAQNIIEVGKELTAAKSEVPHGEWQAWLNDNFGLSYQTAAKFMQVAERFSNVALIRDFNSTQLITMLALPAADTEKFIAEKAAEGTPVEDMTIKTLRAEVAKFKKESEEKDTEISKLKLTAAESAKKYKKAQDKIGVLAESNQKLQAENQQLKDNPVEIITTEHIIPEDYEETKATLVELQDRIFELQEQLASTSTESKPKIAELNDKIYKLQVQLYDAQKSSETLRNEIAAEKYIEQLFSASAALTNAGDWYAAFQNYMKKHPNTNIKLGQLRCLLQQLTGAFNTISDSN